MTPWMNELLDSRGRPESVTWAAMLGGLAGGATLIGTMWVVVVVFTSAGAVWVTVASAVLVVVQATAGMLLIVGAARIALGRGRGLFIGGLVLEFVVCAAHGLNAVAVVGADPDDAGVVGYFLSVAVGFAVVSAGILLLVLRPSARAFRSVLD